MKIIKVLFANKKRILFTQASIVIVMLMMLSFAVWDLEGEQGEAEKEEEKKQISAAVSAEYILHCDATTGKFYKNSTSGEEITSTVASAGITATSNGTTTTIKMNNVDWTMYFASGGSYSCTVQNYQGNNVVCVMYIAGNATIEVTGTCKMTINDERSTAHIGMYYGVYCTGNLEIKDVDGNEGSSENDVFDIEVVNTENMEGSWNGIDGNYRPFVGGIYVNQGDLKINNSIVINIPNEEVTNRGMYCIEVGTGNVYVYRNISIKNDTYVRSNEFSTGYSQYVNYKGINLSSTASKIGASDNAELRGINVINSGNIVIDGDDTNIIIINDNHVETMYGLCTSSGNIINNGGKIDITNKGVVSGYAFFDAGFLGVLNYYENTGNIFGIYVKDSNKSFVMNKGELYIDNACTESMVGADQNDLGTRAYEFRGINSLGGVILKNKSVVNINAYQTKKYKVIYTRNLQIDSSDITMGIAKADKTDEINGIYSDNNLVISCKQQDSLGSDNIITSTIGLDSYKGAAGTVASGLSGICNAASTVSLDYSGDYETVVVKATIGDATSTYPPSSVITSDNIKACSYLELGALPRFHFKYDATNNKMYKVVNGTSTQISDNEYETGWSTSSGNLVLTGFDFVTGANKCLEVVGNGTVTISGVNKLKSTTPCYTSYSSCYGIITSGKIVFNGSGTLSVDRGYITTEYSSYSDKFTAMNATPNTSEDIGSVSFEGGTYTLKGQLYGIYTQSSDSLVDLSVSTATLNVSSSLANGVALNRVNSLTMNNGTIIATCNYSTSSSQARAIITENDITLTNNSTVKVTDSWHGIEVFTGDIVSTNSNIDVSAYCNILYLDEGKINATGGMLKIEAKSAQYANGIQLKKGNLILNNVDTDVNSAKNGIYVEVGIITIEGGACDVTADVNGIVYSPVGTLTVNNCIMNVTGTTYAISNGTGLTIDCNKNGVVNLTGAQVASNNITLDKYGDYRTAIATATTIEDDTVLLYPVEYDFTKYKVAQISSIVQYYLEFNAWTNNFVKLSPKNSTEWNETQVTASDVSGTWSTEATTDTSGNTYYVLKFKDVNFSTAASRCLEIVGNPSSKLVIEGTNSLKANIYYNLKEGESNTSANDATNYGILVRSDNHTFDGSGTLTVSKGRLVEDEKLLSKANFIGVEGQVYTSGKTGVPCKVSGGTYNITGEIRGVHVLKGDLKVEGGKLNVTTSNGNVDDSHIIHIVEGNMTITGGEVTTSTTSTAAIGVVFQGATSKLIINSDAKATLRGPGQGAIVFTESGGTLEMHACVYGSTSYDGTGAIQIVDINESFYSTYRSYEYFKIDPAVMTVNITWGDLEYTGTEKWNARDLVYNTTFATSTGGDQIKISNVGDDGSTDEVDGSNIPVVARISYVEEAFATNQNIKYNLIGKIDGNQVTPDRTNDEGTLDGYQVNVNKDLIYTLGLSMDPYNGKSLTDIAASESKLMGQVTITLSDY